MKIPWSILLILSILSSCRNDDDVSDRKYPVGTIKRVVEVNEVSGFEFFFYDFEYDMDFQLSKLKLSGADQVVFREFTYSYNSEMITEIATLVNSSQSDTSFYTLSDEKIVSFRNPKSGYYAFFNYDSDRLVERRDSILRAAPCYGLLINRYEYNDFDNSVISNLSIKEICDPEIDTTTVEWNWSYELDNMNNPFEHFVPNLFLEDFLSLFPHNIVSDDNMENARFDYSYEYDEQDYPIQRASSNNVGRDNPIIRYEYFHN